MKKSLITFVAILICTIAFANTRKADRLFERWEYFKAAALYEKAAAKHPSADVHYKLGECYMKMNKYSEAQKWYDKVNQAGPYASAQFYLNYGLVLNSLLFVFKMKIE